MAAQRKDLRGRVPATGRDDRRTASQGFGHHYPEPLGARRKPEHVRMAERWVWVDLEADEVDHLGNRKLVSKARRNNPWLIAVS
jgi:hypothetical protein